MFSLLVNGVRVRILCTCVYVLQDLARWKNRRRSVSQDLIKKEEERKMMERLLSDEDGTTQRRKSIKTYREIVEDKYVCQTPSHKHTHSHTLQQRVMVWLGFLFLIFYCLFYVFIFFSIFCVFAGEASALKRS